MYSGYVKRKVEAEGRDTLTEASNTLQKVM